MQTGSGDDHHKSDSEDLDMLQAGCEDRPHKCAAEDQDSGHPSPEHVDIDIRDEREEKVRISFENKCQIMK